MLLGTIWENVSDVLCTGLNTRAGDLMVVKFNYSPAVQSSIETTRVADRMQYVVFMQMKF